MFIHTGIVGRHLAQAVSRIRRERHRPTNKRQQALISEYLQDIQDRAADLGSDDDSDQLATQAGGRA